MGNGLTSINARLTHAEKEKFTKEVDNRCMNVTNILRMFVKKFNTETDATIDFLFGKG